MPESQQRAPASAEDLHYFSTDSDLIDRAELSPDDLAQCVRVMEALREWQESARALSEASNRYMRLNESDMRAIRMMIRAQRQQQIVTPKDSRDLQRVDDEADRPSRGRGASDPRTASDRPSNDMYRGHTAHTPVGSRDDRSPARAKVPGRG